MSAYCKLIEDGDVQRCGACGATFASGGKVRAVCGIERKRPRPPEGGPGTELKKILELIGITASPTCTCNARAKTMDIRGVDWCEEHVDTIVGWLREEAERRGFPFVDIAGRLIVRRAIRNARSLAP